MAGGMNWCRPVLENPAPAENRDWLDLTLRKIADDRPVTTIKVPELIATSEKILVVLAAIPSRRAFHLPDFRLSQPHGDKNRSLKRRKSLLPKHHFLRMRKKAGCSLFKVA
jgi:hypothetical protein